MAMDQGLEKEVSHTDGMHIPLTKRAEETTKYFGTKREHWHNPAAAGQPDLHPLYPPNAAEESDLRLDELQSDLKASKANDRPTSNQGQTTYSWSS